MQHYPIALGTSSMALITPLDPAPYAFVLVGGIVVDDQVQGNPLGHLTIEALEERQPFDVGMLRREESRDLAVEIIQGREEGDRSMAVVVMGLGLHVTYT